MGVNRGRQQWASTWASTVVVDRPPTQQGVRPRAGAVSLTCGAVARLFVYGTLMPGRLRWPLLAPFARAHRRAEVVGALYDSGQGWPVAVFGVDGVVPGVLVELDRPAEALPALDAVEDTATDTLRRIEVTTTDGETAWAYHHAHDVDHLARIDRWDEQEER